MEKNQNFVQQSFSIKNNCKNNFKNLLHSIKNNKSFASSSLLVLDQKNVRIVSSFFKMIELMEFGISGVEKLELQRKKFPKMQAIYLISPCEASVDRLLDDFKAKEQYGIVHLFFSSKLSDPLMEKISLNSSLMNHLYTFKEFNQEFLCNERHLFDLDLSSALLPLYSSPGSDEERKFIEEMTTYLSTLLNSFDRFGAVEILYVKGERAIGKRVAEELRERMQKMIEIIGKANSETIDPQSGKISILLFDRAIDPITPLMHDFFYQPMIYDLLDINNNIAEYEDEDKNGKPVLKKSVLTENDDLFDKYRYKHIAEALDGIPADFQIFMNNNANAKLNKGDIDISEMSEIVKKMPQYNELMKKYTLHMKLIEKAWAIFEDRDIKEIGEIEVCLVTGIDSEGLQIRPSKLLSQVGARLGSSKLTPDEKLRLVLLVCSTLDVSKKDKEALINLLDPAFRPAVEKMNWLLPSASSSKKKNKASKKQSEDMKRLAKSKLSSATLELSRYSSVLETIVESLMECLKKKKPYKEIKGVDIETLEVYSHPGFSQFKKSILTKNRDDEEEETRKASKLVIFAMGGVGLNEIRGVLEIAERGEGIVIVGGSRILKPKEYAEGIGGMRDWKDSFNSSLQSLRQQLFSLKEKNLETLAQKKQAFQTSMSSMEEGLDMLAKDNEKLVSSINVKDEELHHLENIYKYEKTTDSRRQSEKHALSQETQQELLELLDNQKKMSSLLSIEENQENSLLNQEEACYKEALNIYEDIMGLKIIKKDEKILQIRLKTKGEGGWWRKDGGERREKAGGREEEGERREEKEGGREEEGWRRREKEGGRKKEDERGRWEGEEWDDRAEGLGLIELVFEKDKGWRVGKFEDADAREEGERLGKDGRLDIFVKKMRRKIC